MIHHIATRSDWAARSSTGYQPAGLPREGFVHCSAGDQLLDTAHARFAGRRDLLLLDIDENRLRPTVEWEDLYDSGMAFPHVYGPIDLEAVTAIRPFPSDDRGRFDWWAEHDSPVAHPRTHRSPSTQAVLAYLVDAGFDRGPRPLGIRRGLELVTFVPGSTIRQAPPSWLGLESVASLGALLRRAHDATEGFAADEHRAAHFSPLEPGQVILHGALGPGTVTWHDGRATGLIGWSHVRPGDRLSDLGDAAHSFARSTRSEPNHGDTVEASLVAARLSALAAGYGDVTPAAIRRAAGAEP